MEEFIAFARAFQLAKAFQLDPALMQMRQNFARPQTNHQQNIAFSK